MSNSDKPEKNIENFYFTYGLEGQPFVGGWTVVKAPDMETAISIFKIVHPGGNLVPCAGIYCEDNFVKTKMYESGNFGARCVEEITLSITRKNDSPIFFI